MKIKINFKITKRQFEDLMGAIGYSEEVVDPKTGQVTPNERTREQVLNDALKEHMSYFLDMFVKQRIHTKLRKEEDLLREKELKPAVDSMNIVIK